MMTSEDGKADDDAGEALTLDESMKWCLHYFYDAIQTLTKAPEEIFEDYGKCAAVSWELRQDILAGMPLVEWQGMQEDTRIKIGRIVEEAVRMPDRSFYGKSMEELYDPAWVALKKTAVEFMEEHCNDEGVRK